MTDEKAIEAAARAVADQFDKDADASSEVFAQAAIRAYLAQREADGWVMVNLRHVSVSEGPPMIAAAPGRDDGR